MLADPRLRRLGYLALALLLAVLCLVPPPYEARAKIVPQDSGTIGLGSMVGALGGQAGGFAALLGGARQPTDLHLATARSAEVADAVIRGLRLDRDYGSPRRARLAMARKVDIHSLTGGVLEIEARTHDADEARRLTAAYVAAVSQRLAWLGRERVTRKRAVVLARSREAATRVARAETALAGYRRAHNLAAPEAQLGSALSLRAGLQAQLQAKQVELQTLARFQGAENPQLQAVRSDIASLGAQIARTAAPASDAAGPNVAGLSETSGRYLDLFRDYKLAQALYEVYARASEEVTVEALAAETASDAQVIEAAHVDADRKFNIPAVALLALLLLAALFTEVYAPATGIAPPWRRS